MKTLNEILDNYKDYAVVLDDRFGSRLAKFLTEEQLEKIGFKYDMVMSLIQSLRNGLERISQSNLSLTWSLVLRRLQTREAFQLA